MIFLFSSSLTYQGHTNKQLPSLADSCIIHWFKLFYKIPLILYFEHLQDFAKEISSSYFISLPKPKYLHCLKYYHLDSFHQCKQFCILNLIRRLHDIKGIILFLSKVDLASLPGTGFKFSQKNIYSRPFHNNPLGMHFCIKKHQSHEITCSHILRGWKNSCVIF